ncbi:MAG: hypothetical protein ACMUHM_02980 [Thermoplasmatota archaeon]
MGSSKSKKGKGIGKKRPEPKVKKETKEIGSVVEEEDRYVLFTNLGLSVAGLRKDITTLSKALKSGKDEAEELRNRLKEKMDSTYNKWLDARVAYGINFSEKGLKLMKDKGLDRTLVKKKIDQVKKLLKKGEHTDAFSILKEIRSDLDGLFSKFPEITLPEGWEVSDKALDAYQELRAPPKKMGQPKKFFKKLVKFLEEKDFDESLVYSNLLYTTIQHEMGDEISRDRFKAIQDEVSSLMDTMEEFRKFGIEPEGMHRELKKLETLEPGKFSEAQTTINRLSKNLSRAEKEYFRRKGSVNILEAEELIDEYGSLLDMGEERKKAERLKKSQTRLSPRKYMEESTTLLSGIKDVLFENFEGQVKERMAALDENIDRIHSEENRKKVQELQQSVNLAFENKDISEAMEYLSLAEAMIGQTEGEEKLVNVAERYGSFLSQYETLLNENLELEELKEEISEIERLFLSDEVKEPEIVDRVSAVEDKIKDRMVEVRMDGLERQRTSFIGLMETLNVPPERFGRIENMFDDMAGSIPEINEKDYQSRMEGIRNEMDEELSGYFRENYDSWASEIQTSIEKLAKEKVEISKMQTRLDEAGKYHRERNYLVSGEVLRGLRNEIDTIENGFLQDEAEERIDSADFLFEEAARAGVDVSTMEDELKRAKELLKEGETKEADVLAIKVENEIRNRWKEKKKETLMSDIDDLKGYIGESDELGLDISDASDLMAEAEKLFKQEKFDEVSEVVNKARETVMSERNQYYSESAMDSIKKLKQEISNLSDMGVNTLEVETLLIEAERQFMNEEYEKAYSLTLDIREQIGQSRDGFMRERVPRDMEEALKKVGRLEVMGLDTRDVKKYLDLANDTMAEGDLYSTMGNLNKAMEISDEMFKTHISLTIPDTLVDVKKQLGSALDEGLELDDVRGMLEEAEDLFQNEEYDMAMEQIERAQDRFNLKRDNFYQNQYQSNLTAVEDILGSVSGMDGEIDLSRDNINMAKDAYERGDFEVSHRLMSKVMKFLESAVDNKEHSKRRDIVQTYYDEVRTLLMVCEGENINVMEERKLFHFAGELLTKGDFDQAEHVLEGIKKGLNDKRVAMKKNLIESSIQTAEILLKNLNEMGVDTTYENELIIQLKEALRKGDLDACERINLKLTELLQRNQGPYMVQKVQKDLADLRARVVDATSKGLDVTEVQTVMSRAIEQFELGDMQSAQEKIDTANEMLKKVFKDHDFAEYARKQEELRKSLSELRTMGIPVDDEEELVRKGDELARDGEMEEALSWIEVAQIGANAKINTFQSATAEGYITQIQSYLDELASKGTDIEDLLKIYHEGMELHRGGKDDKAVAKFSSILELGEELRTLQELDSEKEMFAHSKRTYDDLKAVGMKGSKKVSGLIKDIDEMFHSDSMDIEKIRSSVEKLGKVIDKKSRPYLPNLAKKRITDARKSYQEILDRGLEDPSIPGKIKEAGEKFRAKDYEEADRLANQIFEGIEALKKSETGQMLAGEIDQVKQMLTRLKTLGSNVTYAENLLSRADATLSEGRIENAEKLIRSVRQSVKDIVRRNMRETALETIEFVDAMIHYLKDNFSGISTKLAPAEGKLDDARELFMEKKFKAAKAKGEEARVNVEKLDLANIKQFLYVFRSMQGEEMLRDVSLRLDELGQKGTDVTKARVLFTKAKEHLEKDEFDKGRQMITLSRIMISELDQQSLRDKAFDELNNAHVEILTRKKMGGNVTQAYKTYNSAKDSFSLREYKKSILLAKRASYQAKSAATKG